MDGFRNYNINQGDANLKDKTTCSLLYADPRMCVCVHIYIVYIRIYLCTYIYIIHVCPSIFVWVCICIYMFVCKYGQSLNN